MKILVLSINYSPEPTGFSPHVAAACEHFVRRGHEVRVITGFPFAPRWQRWPEYRGRLFSVEHLQGVPLRRVTHYIPRRAGTILARIGMEATFCLMALPFVLAALIIRRPDVILYVGAQPSIALLARTAAALGRTRYAININDLATQAGSDVGIIPPGWKLRLLSNFEFLAYRRAAGAMILCDSFATALREHGFTGPIRLIRPPIDIDLVRPGGDGQGFRQQLGLAPNDFLILFSGSMGLKQDLLTVIEAANLVSRQQRQIKWLLVGEGEQREQVARRIAELGLESSVRLEGFQPEERMADMYAASDILLLSQLKSVKDSVIPSKLLTYMSAGRPVVAAVNNTSQGAAVLGEAGGGWVVPPEDSAGLAVAVLQLERDRGSLVAMGSRNRAYAVQHFDRAKIVAAQEEFLKEILMQP